MAHFVLEKLFSFLRKLYFKEYLGGLVRLRFAFTFG